MLKTTWNRYPIALLPVVALVVIPVALVLDKHFILSIIILAIGIGIAVGVFARQVWLDEVHARND